MLLGRTSSSSSSGSTSSVKKVEVDTLITEEEFNKLFPQGFTVTSPEESVKEYWCLGRGMYRAIRNYKTNGSLLPLVNPLSMRQFVGAISARGLFVLSVFVLCLLPRKNTMVYYLI